MKKSALALAVAAALVGFGSAAYADTTLYGSGRVSVDYDDYDSTYSYLGGSVVTRVVPGSSSWDVYDDTSRLGVRGEEDLGGGLAAIYQMEFGVDMTEGGNWSGSRARPKWVGLKGSSWGSVTVGTQWTPYYNALGIGDIFNSAKVYSSSLNYGASQSPNLNAYLGNAFGLREDNSLMYSSPNWSGFGFQAMLVMNGAGVVGNQTYTLVGAQNPSDNIDLWNIGLSYKNGPFFAGASYMALNNGNDVWFPKSGFPVAGGTDSPDLWGLAFGYNAGPFAFSITYEDGDLQTVTYGKAQNLWLTGTYTFGNNVIRAAYGYLSPDDSRINLVTNNVPVSYMQDDQNSFAVGYQYNFSKRTRVWVEWLGRYIDDSHPADIANISAYGDSQTVSIGTRVDF